MKVWRARGGLALNNRDEEAPEDAWVSTDGGFEYSHGYVSELLKHHGCDPTPNTPPPP